jgi:hypothetical protein
MQYDSLDWGPVHLGLIYVKLRHLVGYNMKFATLETKIIAFREDPLIAKIVPNNKTLKQVRNLNYEYLGCHTGYEGDSILEINVSICQQFCETIEKLRKQSKILQSSSQPYACLCFHMDPDVGR